SWLSARPRKSRTSPDRAPERSSPAPSAEPALPQPAPSRCRAISIHRQRPPIIGRGPLSYPSLAEAADDTAHEIVLEAVESRPELAEAQCVDQSDDGDPDGHGPQDGLVRAVEAELLEALAQWSEGRPGSLGRRTEPRLLPHGSGSGGTVSGLCDQLHESDHGTRARHDGLLPRRLIVGHRRAVDQRPAIREPPRPVEHGQREARHAPFLLQCGIDIIGHPIDRKSTRLNSSHVSISYAVFCLKNKRKRR